MVKADEARRKNLRWIADNAPELLTRASAKLSERQRQYLKSVPDWTPPCVIAARLGWPETSGMRTMPHLQRLAKRGLVEWCGWSLAWRITEAGRAALTEGEQK